LLLLLLLLLLSEVATLKDFRSEIGVGEHTDYGLLTILKQVRALAIGFGTPKDTETTVK